MKNSKRGNLFNIVIFKSDDFKCFYINKKIESVFFLSKSKGYI